MPHEAIAEILVGIAEIGVESAVNNKDKKSGCGCLIVTIVIIGILLAAYYYLTSK